MQFKESVADYQGNTEIGVNSNQTHLVTNLGHEFGPERRLRELKNGFLQCFSLKTMQIFFLPSPEKAPSLSNVFECYAGVLTPLPKVTFCYADV